MRNSGSSRKRSHFLQHLSGKFSFNQSNFGISISGEIDPPTQDSTSCLVSLILCAWSIARWSSHIITFLWLSCDGLTVTGSPTESRATSEHVASKPMPFIFWMKSLSLLIEEETSYKFGKLGAQLGFKGLLFLLNTCYFFTGGRWQLFKGPAIPRNTRKSKLERQY